MLEEKQQTTHSNTRVRVSSPARLHLGFLDLNGELGRKFGSIGLAIDTHRSSVTVEKSASIKIDGPTVTAEIEQKIQSIISAFYNSLGKHIPPENKGIHLSCEQLIPEHAGLGSGTQLALVIGTALCKLFGITASTPDIAEALGRGARSGIGIATFDHGGFIVDAGLGKSSTVPLLLTNNPFPEAWHIVLILQQGHQGIHGSEELTAFSELPPFPKEHAQAICHLTLMQLMPSLKEENIDLFGDSITRIQAYIGDHFAPAQGGRYTSKEVESLLLHAQKLGHTGIAQSSWGPTGCIFVKNRDEAQKLVEALKNYRKKALDYETNTSFIIAKSSSGGANIQVTP